MNRAEKLQTKWATANKLMAGVTIHLPEGEALVLDQGPARGQWWAWSVKMQAYVLVQDHGKNGGGWYEYRTGSGLPLDQESEATA